MPSLSVFALSRFFFLVPFYLVSASVLTPDQATELVGTYTTVSSTVLLGERFDDMIERIASGSDAGAMIVRDASLNITVLYVDEESGIFGGFKETKLPTVKYIPEFERLLGRARPINETTLQLTFGESADTGMWEGDVNLSNGVLTVQRIEGQEVVGSDGQVLDNQASSLFVMQKVENGEPFNVSAAAVKAAEFMARGGATQAFGLTSILMIISSVI